MPAQPPSIRSSIEAYSIGSKLRRLRFEKHLTLSQLAAETRMSTALLSKLETNRMLPTLPTLAAISRVYGVGLGFFFKEATKHVLGITRRAHLVRIGSTQEGPKRIDLNTREENAALRASIVEYPVGTLGPLTEVGQAVTCVVYVVEGELQLEAGGMRDVLETGDCLYLNTDMVVTYKAPTNCRALVVTAGELRKERVVVDAS